MNRLTKFEVSLFTHYEDMKGNANVEMGLVWGLEVTQGHWQYHIHYSTYDFLFDFNGNHVSILYRFQVMASYLLIT